MSRDWGITITILILVGGSLALAHNDPSARAAFLDLAKIGVGGYLGYSMPRRGTNE